MAAALPPENTENEVTADGTEETSGANETIDQPIDENLFAGDDLDLVEEELETLDLAD